MFPLKNILILLTLSLGSTTAFSFQPNKVTLAACEKFQAQVKADGLVESGHFEAPLNHEKPSGEKIRVYYWRKKGTDSQKPPLLLLHGGPGGNSWRYYSAFKASTYAGDIVSFDNRNEGCSHVLDYNLPVASYEYFRARNIARDGEILRLKLYGSRTKWRLFGQSRGGPIAHYYFEMFPSSLESVQTHGYAMTSIENTLRYTYNRSLYNARAGDRFAQMFPEAAQVIRDTKKLFSEKNICMPMDLNQQGLELANRPVACGANLTDAISYKLSNFSRWKDIAAPLVALRKSDGAIDEAKAISLFQSELNGNIYVQFMNYIMGTNGFDVASPAPRNFEEIENDPYLNQALISEGRLVSQVVYPAYLAAGHTPFRGYADPVDFKKIKKFLSKYRKRTRRDFSFTLFSSYYDTIAAPELYQEEHAYFGDLVQIVPLAESGHEGWQTEASVTSFLTR